MLFNPIKTNYVNNIFTNLMSQQFVLIFLSWIIGILMYFYGIPLTFILSLFFISFIGLVLLRHRQIVCFIFFLIFAFSLGFFRIYIRTQNLNHRILNLPLYHSIIQADVIQNITLPDQQILTLHPTEWPLGHFKHPEKIRLYFDKIDPVIQSGDHVRLRATIWPPNKVQAPFQISQSQRLYFEKVGAIGKVETILFHYRNNHSLGFFQNLRNDITQYLFKILPENQARIATPLITGEQRFVSPKQYQNYRRSGLAHVLSVSGFHMALLAMFVFFLVRSFCVLTHLTLYINSKKLAAFTALIITAFYLGLSNFQIPALRSFGMIALVFLGILTDRKAFSLHSLILVGFVMLLWAPELLLSISFQLSFLSVFILICVHNQFKKFAPQMNKNIHHFCEFILLNIAITAGLTPLIAWHFNQFMPYALLGNICFSFIFSFGIMPLLFVGCLLMLLGCGVYFFKAAGFLLELVEQLTSYLSQWPYAEISIASFNPIALGLIILGIILICLMHFKRLWLGGIFVFTGTIWAYLTPQPVMMLLNNSVAYIQKDVFYQKRDGHDWVQNVWRQKMGYSKTLKVDLPNVIFLKGKKIALSPQSCPNADYAILSHKDSRCRIPTLTPEKNKFYLIYIIDNKIYIRIFDE